ncbi:hypothetical protein [Streptomyces luteireticuli]|uniref:hypothetical protein n=1 Tax=Streptomyces luteireticuli TaxID=173858 RepID=UPI003557A29C
MSAAVVVALLGGFVGPAAAVDESSVGRRASVLRALSSVPATGPAAPPKQSRLAALIADSDRKLVEDIAELAEEEEVREAAKKALASSDPNAIREFLEHGQAEAHKRAQEKKDAADAESRRKIEAMRGTGGPNFEKEVDRVLKGSARDRADFLAFGADIARQRDKKTEDNEKQRAAENRKRVEMLAAVGGPEVKRAAQVALATNDDKAIAEFLAKGYLEAAQKDADAQAAHEKAEKEAREAAEKLRELAEKTARAAEARTKLINAHGDAVKALKMASNAMNSAAAASRQADRMLAADRAGKRLSEYDPVKTEVARQVEYAGWAAKAADVAARQAKTQADVLVETGLTHGVEWAEVAAGIKEAADAALKASETAQHAVDATAADAAGLKAKNQAQLHEQQAKQWRANAEQHSKAAAKLAAAADKQAKIAANAAGRSKQARIDAEKAEAAAWDHARKTREARVEAQRQAKIAAEQRAIAEHERALAAEARARAERERDNAAEAKARAEAEARDAAAKRADAQAAAADAAEKRSRAAEQESNAGAAEESARGEEAKAREARDKAYEAERAHKADEAKARAADAIAASLKGTEDAAQAEAYATVAHLDAKKAGEAADRARSAADEASAAAMRSRAAATEAAGAAARARAAASEATAHAAQANAAANKAEAAASAANAAANKAQSEAAATHAAAQRANSKASEATAQEARAGIAAHEAARLAGLAAVEAGQSLQAANRTRDEADGAVREAATARVQATVAVQASMAARSTAAGIADPANTAIQLTAPFSGTDVDADFAAEVAKAAQEMGEKEVATAEARANEADKAADAADAAAKRANAQVAPAFKAAADAARSSASAARSSAAAMKSAAEASAEAVKARAAATRANQADSQAQADAKDARQAANQAYADAAAARQAATQAEAEAERARGAATEAENQAAAAVSAATQAEKEASVAQSAATQAAKDAEDARKLADSAEAHAKSAEDAAKNADKYAREADIAAKKAEAEERAAKLKELAEAAKRSTNSGAPEASSEEEEALKEAGISPDEFKEDQELADKDVFDYLKENGAQILVDLFYKEIEECIDTGDVQTCITAILENLPVAKLAKIGWKTIPKLFKTVWGIDKFLEKTAAARKRIKKYEEALEKIRKRIPDCDDRSDRDKDKPKKLKTLKRAGFTPTQGGPRPLASSPAIGVNAHNAAAANPPSIPAFNCDVGNVRDDILEETKATAKSNVGIVFHKRKSSLISKYTITLEDAMATGYKFLGPGARDVSKGRGIFRSADNRSGFRVDPDSLVGGHWPDVPHVHFEIFDEAGKPLANNHVPLSLGKK